MKEKRPTLNVQRPISNDVEAAEKDPATAAATDRAAAKVSIAVDHAGDNTPTKPGTEAAKAAAGTNETRPDSAQLPEKE